jgi:hypothetical protein
VDCNFVELQGVLCKSSRFSKELELFLNSECGGLSPQPMV